MEKYFSLRGKEITSIVVANAKAASMKVSTLVVSFPLKLKYFSIQFSLLGM
jgi:hypothetical protein